MSTNTVESKSKSSRKGIVLIAVAVILVLAVLGIKAVLNVKHDSNISKSIASLSEAMKIPAEYFPKKVGSLRLTSLADQERHGLGDQPSAFPYAYAMYGNGSDSETVNIWVFGTEDEAKTWAQGKTLKYPGEVVELTASNPRGHHLKDTTLITGESFRWTQGAYGFEFQLSPDEPKGSGGVPVFVENFQAATGFAP